MHGKYFIRMESLLVFVLICMYKWVIILNNFHSEFFEWVYV